MKKQTKKRQDVVIMGAFLVLILFLAAVDEFHLAGMFDAEISVTIDPGARIIRDHFDGATPNFLFIDDASLSNFTNLTLENTTAGKVTFLSSINLTEIQDGNIVNLDYYSNFTHNHIEINTAYFTNLKKAANISIYNLTFADPIVQKDGATCTTCTILRYTGGTLVFSVTSFSVYQAI